MNKLLLFVLSLSIILVLVPPSSGHGRLINPPSRSSAWRYKFKTPTNYNDHEIYCGGFSRQWQRNGGKCGVCGDPWDEPQPRANELGGKYGLGVIVAVYRHASAIEIGVQLTASHRGYFEFNICPYNNKRPVTENCLDRYPLRRADGNGARFYPDVSRTYNMRYNLPWGVTCRHCVLRWRYVAANNWGRCANGTGKLGCGPQEEFRSCADIRITQFGRASIKASPTESENIWNETEEYDINEGLFIVENNKRIDYNDHHSLLATPNIFTCQVLCITIIVLCVIIILLIILQKVSTKREKQTSPVDWFGVRNDKDSKDVTSVSVPQLYPPIRRNGTSFIPTISMPSAPIGFIPTE